MRTIPKEIRHEVNHLAHNLAMQYETDTRNSMLAQLKAAAESGASSRELEDALKKYQAQSLRRQP